MPNARPDTLVVGIGNPLREDDRAGIEVVERLEAHFAGGMKAMVVYEPDICLAETMAQYSRVIIVDAIASDQGAPFKSISIEPASGYFPDRGVSSHCFNWKMILAMARDLYGSAPQTSVITVSASEFGISQSMSPQCQANADAAFQHIVGMVTSSDED